MKRKQLESSDSVNDSSKSPMTETEDYLFDQSSVINFVEFLDQEPDAVENTKEIFNQYISWNEFNPEKAKYLKNALSVYLGNQNTDFLLDLLISCLDNEDDSFLVKLKEVEPRIEKMVRFLLSLYGSAIEKNYLAQDENPNSWRALLPKVDHEIFSGQFVVKLEIEKYSGDVVVFEETPLSVVQLISTLLSILNEIPSRDISPSIPLKEIKDLEEVFEEFVNIFKDEDEDENEEE
jgi:hypothetical protein